MFRLFRSWHGDIDMTPMGEEYSDPFYMAYSEPRPAFAVTTESGAMTTLSYPAATGALTSMGGFTIPRKVMHFGTAAYDAYTFSCGGYQGPCAPGYPISIYYYSYYNYKGVFAPQNPYAATTYRKIKRITTSTDFTTTQFNNNYAFGRIGSIKITPGPNRFGGTMRYFWGLNARSYQYITTDPTACCEVGYGHNWRTGMGPYGSPTGMFDFTEYSPQEVAGTYIAFEITREHTLLTTGAGAPLTRMVHYFYTTAPWTTGAISVFVSASYVSSALQSGSDNRTDNLEMGTLSLVVPWLTNQYLSPFDPTDPITSNWHNARVNKVVVTFLPEPVSILLLGAGVLGLAGVYRLRRR